MKPIVLKAALVSISIILAIGFFELFLRFFVPKPENLAKLQSSSAFLYENKPSGEFEYVGSEFNIPIKLNSYGFRDTEFTIQKDQDIFRIAVLGDSQEEALQVSLSDTWQKVMVKKLSDDLGKRVETYNFGVSGYGTDQQWLTLRDKVWKFSPDMILLAFSPNDVGDTYKNRLIRLNGDKIEVISSKERAGGNFLGKAVRETYIWHMIIKASSGNAYLKRVVDKVRVKILGFPKEDRFFLSDAQLIQGPFEVFASQKNPPPEVDQTWDVIRALLFDIEKQAKEHDAEFLVTVNIPRAQVDPDSWEFVRSQYHLDVNTSSPYQINEKMSEVTGELGIDYYDPRLDAIDWYKKNGILHWPSDAHFNINGNLFMGTKVAEYIEKKSLIPKLPR